MDNRAKLALVAVSLMLLSGIAVYAIYQIAPLDPLAQFRTADGHLTFPGGALTADLQRLLFPGPAPKDYTVWTPVRSAYPTLAIHGVKYDLPVAAHVPQPIKPLGTDSIKVFLDALARIPKDILSFFTQDAAAACTGGACFWIGGTGNFSDSTHWSLLTGGVTCVCTPGSTDSVTFDASSGAGTATQNNATFTSGAVVMTNSSVTISGSSNTWKVGGSWSDANNHFSMSTSTVEFTATGTLSPAETNGASYFYNFTVSGGTITISVPAFNHRWGIARAFTVSGGTLTTDGLTAQNLFLFNDGGSTTFFTYSGGSITAASTSALLVLDIDNSGGASPNISFPGGTYTNVNFIFEARFATNATFTLQGNFIANGMSLGFDGPVTVNTNTRDITLAASLSTNPSGTAAQHLTSTSGTWSIHGLAAQGNTNWYWTAGSISVTDAGDCGGGCAYRNGSATDSWDGSSASYTYTGQGGVFRPGSFTTAIEWGTIQLKTSSGGVTYTLENNGPRWGALTLNAFNGTPVLNTANFDMRLTSYGPNSSGGTLTAGSSTITVNGNWDSSVGTFTPGTSTIVFAASGTTTVGSPSLSDFNVYNVTINTAVTMTAGSDIGVKNQLVMSGTGSIGGSKNIGVGFTNTVSQVNPLTIGTGTMGGTVLYLTNNTSPGNFNIPASANYTTLNPWPIVNSATVTLTGDITVQRLNVNNNTGAVTGAKVDANTRTVTVTGDLYVGWYAGSSISGALVFSTGHVAVSGNVTVNANSATYVQWGSGSHTLAGTYTNNCPSTCSASWSAGTGTATFTSATGGTMTFAGAKLAGNEFNNATFTSSAGTAQTFTMATNALKVGGTLTVSDGSSTTALSTSGSNLAVTAGAVTIGAGGIVTANASTITVSGNWNSSAGTFTFGTSTISVNGSGKTYTFGSGQFYNYNTNNNAVTIDNVSIATGGTLTAGSSVVTVPGNWNSSAGTFTPGTSLVIMTGTGKTVQTTFYDLEISGTVTALAPLTVTHDLTIDSGKSLDLAGLAFTLGHNLTDSGSLLNVTNTTLNGSSAQTITGTENIHLGTMTVSGAEKDFTSDFTTANVTKSGGSNVTMAISPGIIWSVPDDTHLEGGGPTSYLVLRSGTPGSAWLFHPGASTNGAYVDVQDSTANFPVVCTYFCVDSGRNFDWVFTSGGGGGGGGGQGTGTTQGFVLAAPSVSDLVLWTEIALLAIVLIGLAGIFIFKPQGKAKKWAWIIVLIAALVLVLIYFAPMFFTFG